MSAGIGFEKAIYQVKLMGNIQTVYDKFHARLEMEYLTLLYFYAVKLTIISVPICLSLKRKVQSEDIQSEEISLFK